MLHALKELPESQGLSNSLFVTFDKYMRSSYLDPRCQSGVKRSYEELTCYLLVHVEMPGTR